MTAAHTLDARGLLCPLPVIRIQDRVKDLDDGEVLEITATDPGVLQDIPAWCRVHGHHVLDCDERADDILVRIKVVRD